MIILSHDEQLEVDQAVHDGDGWALPPGMPEGLQQQLESKGIIRFEKDRWQLTPVGFSYSRMFEGR